MLEDHTNHLPREGLTIKTVVQGKARITLRAITSPGLPISPITTTTATPVRGPQEVPLMNGGQPLQRVPIPRVKVTVLPKVLPP